PSVTFTCTTTVSPGAKSGTSLLICSCSIASIILLMFLYLPTVVGSRKFFLLRPEMPTTAQTPGPVKTHPAAVAAHRSGAVCAPGQGGAKNCGPRPACAAIALSVHGHRTAALRALSCHPPVQAACNADDPADPR